MLASARLNNREAAKKITAGITRGNVRGCFRLFRIVVFENRIKTTIPNNAKGHKGFFVLLIMSDVFDILQMPDAGQPGPCGCLDA